MSVLRLAPPKGEAIVVDADEALVGREASCNVIVLHPSVSRRHALIKRKQDVFFVVDQGSANGTFVDSKRIVDGVLKEGAVLRFGSVAFKVEIEETRDDARVESVDEEEFAVAPTVVAQPSFSATVLEDDALSEEAPTPRQGTAIKPPVVEEPAPTVQSPVLRAPAAPVARPERPRPHIPSQSIPPRPPAAAPNRGPAFWLMILAAALALLLVGAALGLGMALIARRMGLF